jgi:hypothetical protein
MTVATYIICFGILFVGAMTKDHDSFKVRAVSGCVLIGGMSCFTCAGSDEARY